MGIRIRWIEVDRFRRCFDPLRVCRRKNAVVCGCLIYPVTQTTEDRSIRLSNNPRCLFAFPRIIVADSALARKTDGLRHQVHGDHEAARNDAGEADGLDPRPDFVPTGCPNCPDVTD